MSGNLGYLSFLGFLVYLLFLFSLMIIFCILFFIFKKKRSDKPWKTALYPALAGMLLAYFFSILIVINLPTEYNGVAIDFSFVFLFPYYVLLYSALLYIFYYYYFLMRNEREKERTA